MSIVPIRNLGKSELITKYLYFEGNEQIGRTGGWTTDGYTFQTRGTDGSITKTANRIQESAPSQYGLLGTVKAINFTGKSTLKIHYSNLGYSNQCIVDIESAKAMSGSGLVYGVGSGITTDFTYTFDVSTINGNQYLTLINSQAGYTSGSIDWISLE